MAEVEQLCTRIGVLDAGRLVLQDNLAALRAPTGRIVVDTPDADRAVALLDGQVERRDGDQLLVRPVTGDGAAGDAAAGDAAAGGVAAGAAAAGAAAALNARLVRAGLRVSAIGPQQRTLEEIVLSVTGTGSDHIGPDDAGPDQAGPDRAGGSL
jgi:ABC-2 type transport system ATP-binding protein